MFGHLACVQDTSQSTRVAKKRKMVEQGGVRGAEGRAEREHGCGAGDGCEHGEDDGPLGAPGRPAARQTLPPNFLLPRPCAPFPPSHP